jgi:hypothetical protein
VLGLDRLLEIVGRAVAQRLDRAVDRRVRGEQNERHARCDPPRAVEQREADMPSIWRSEITRSAGSRSSASIAASALSTHSSTTARRAHREPAHA